jgi:hypothetical protein
LRRTPVKFAIEKSVAASASTGYPLVGNVKCFFGAIPDYLLEVKPDKEHGLVVVDPDAAPGPGPRKTRAPRAAATAAPAAME